jgi:HAD superfamily hydrolase (TIGR01509 family)
MTPNSSLPAAVIFDMDGVLIDSNPFHLRKWAAFLREHRIPFDEDKLAEIVLGPPNETIFQRYFGDQITPERMQELSEEVEAEFRRAFAPHARPSPGVRRLIEACRAQGIPMAVASCAISKNVEFLVTALELRPYFRVLLSRNEITHAKPDPEIYLKTAAKLGIEPALCVVFEDSFVGIEAAKRAGMKCVAIASSFPAADLRQETCADLVVPSFEAVTLETLRALFDGNAAGGSPSA